MYGSIYNNVEQVRPLSSAEDALNTPGSECSTGVPRSPSASPPSWIKAELSLYLSEPGVISVLLSLISRCGKPWTARSDKPYQQRNRTRTAISLITASFHVGRYLTISPALRLVFPPLHHGGTSTPQDVHNHHPRVPAAHSGIHGGRKRHTRGNNHTLAEPAQPAFLFRGHTGE